VYPARKYTVEISMGVEGEVVGEMKRQRARVEGEREALVASSERVCRITWMACLHVR
jgi:hypothetical protein